MLKPLRGLVRAAKALAVWGFALLVLFEEWGWTPLARLLGTLSRLPVIAALERRIARLPPVGALAVCFTPAVLLLPLKIAALWLIGRGQVAAGVLLIVIAKVAGTALFARLFMLTQPQLLRLAWFARLYRRWLNWKHRALSYVRRSAAWRALRVLKRRVRRWWRQG